MTTLFFLDFETTGLERTSRITEIACVCPKGNEKEKWFETLVNPGISIPMEVQILTGITDSMVKFAAKEKNAIESLLSFINNKDVTDCTLVSHNAVYDKAIFQSACQRHGLAMPEFKWICTLKMARAFSKWHKKSCTLENCVKRVNQGYNFEGKEKEEDESSTFKFHRAMGDVRACMKIYKFLVKNNNVAPEQEQEQEQQTESKKQKKSKKQKEEKEEKDEFFHSEFPLEGLGPDMETIPCIAAAICGNYYMDPLAMTKTSGLCNSCSDALDYHYTQEQSSEMSFSFLTNQTNSIIDKLVQSNAALTLLALSKDNKSTNKPRIAKRARD